MRKILFILSSGIFLIVFLGLNLQNQKAQENPSVAVEAGSIGRNLEVGFEKSIFEDRNPPGKSSNIKDIQVFGESSGIAFTDDTLFKTGDNGETWREIALSRDFNETLGGVSFIDEFEGWVIL